MGNRIWKKWWRCL